MNTASSDLGGGLRPPSDGRRAPDGALLVSRQSGTSGDGILVPVAPGGSRGEVRGDRRCLQHGPQRVVGNDRIALCGWMAIVAKNVSRGHIWCQESTERDVVVD